MEYSIELDTLIRTGFEISLQCEQIEETLQFLNSLNPNNIKGMTLFALFQKKVVEDEFGAYEAYMKYGLLCVRIFIA